MRTRKKEIEQIISVLEREHDDVIQLAEDIWKLIDNARRERELYVVGVDHEGMGQYIYGTYDSVAQIEKDLSDKGNLRGMSRGDRLKVFKVLSSSSMADEPLSLFDMK